MEFFRGGVPSNGRASLTFMLQGALFDAWPSLDDVSLQPRAASS
jgi:hypothetical protein